MDRNDNRLVVLLSAVLLMTGCSGFSSPIAPTQSSVNISGTWVETPGTLPATLSLAQSGNSITGTYVRGPYSGTVSGTSTGNNVSLTLTPGNPQSCGMAFTGMVAGGTRMTGTIVLTNCTESGGGAIVFIKQ